MLNTIFVQIIYLFQNKPWPIPSLPLFVLQIMLWHNWYVCFQSLLQIWCLYLCYFESYWPKRANFNRSTMVYLHIIGLPQSKPWPIPKFPLSDFNLISWRYYYLCFQSLLQIWCLYLCLSSSYGPKREMASNF